MKAKINWVAQWRGEGDKEVLLKEIANEYEFLNQDIRVNLVFRDDLYKLPDEPQFLLEQIKKPTADWDIVVRMHVNYPIIASTLNDMNWGEKYLVDFSKIPGFMEAHKSFINTPKYRYQFGGMLYGPYNEGQIAALYLNTEVAKKMGITVKQFDMTFDDFLGYLKQAFEYNQSHPYIAPIFDERNWIMSEIIFKKLFLSQLDNFEMVMDTKQYQKKLAALEMCYDALDQMAKYKPVYRNRASMNFWEHTDFALNDSCLFFPNFTFIYNFWKMQGKEKMKKILPCELPSFKPSDTYIGGFVANWAVLNNAPHREEATKLMMFWCNPEISEKWVRMTKSPSGTKGNMAENVLGADQFESYMYYIEKKYGDRLILDNDNKYILGEKNFNVPFYVIDVLEGRMTGKQAFEKVKKQLVY